MFDQTDLAIIGLLRENSRMQWKEIGEKVHMTGQAVASRVQALLDAGVIEKFTIETDRSKLGDNLFVFINVFMGSKDHGSFLNFVRSDHRILETHRISGEGCYFIKAALPSHDSLNNLLESILRFGNYRINISLGKIDSEE